MVIAPSAPLSNQAHSDLAAARRDRRLVQAHRAGDTNAFAAIVEAYHTMLLRQARRQLGNPCDAEDAVQETLLRAYRGLERFGASGDWRLGAWFTRIMTNVCIDLRARRNASAALANRLGPGAASGGDVGDLASDPVALAAVRQALDGLPASQRQAFVLRAVNDLSFAEIADQLGISEDNARTRVQRARTALRRALDRTVVTTLAAVPLAAARVLRMSPQAARRPVLRRAPNRTAAGISPGLPRALSAGGARTMGASTTHITSRAAQAASMAQGTADPSGTMSALRVGTQFVNQVAGQVAASPAGQMLLATASATSGSGGGRSALVFGLAASVATAGALTLPPTRPPMAHRQATQLLAAPVRASPAATALPSAASPPPAGSTTSAMTGSDGKQPPTGNGTSTSTIGTVGAANSTAGTSSTTNARGGTADEVTPGWVLTATGGAAAGTTKSADPSKTAAGTARGSGSSGSGTGTSGPGISATTTSGTATSAGATTVLPAGSCASVAGFPGVTTNTSVAPTGTATVERMLHTGPVDLTAIGLAPSFSTDAPLTANGVDKTGPLQVAVGTCLATAGSILAVDLTGDTGTEVQLVGNLLSATPTDASAPSAGTTYLFAGAVNPYAGILIDGLLPWGLTDQFVAELQVAEPANTAELTVAFILLGGSTTNPDPTTVGNPSGASSPTTTGESTSGGTTNLGSTAKTGTTGTGTTETGSVASDVPGASSTSSDGSSDTGSGATSGSSSGSTATSSSASPGGAGSAG